MAREPFADVDPTRRRIMASIRTRGTKPELHVRSALHRLGYRFTTNSGKLPGRPDIIFTRKRIAVFVHGCFWHQHGCSNSNRPKSRPEFWNAKLDRNIERDELVVASLLELGWRVAVVWECAVRRDAKDAGRPLIREIATWIRERQDPYRAFE